MSTLYRATIVLQLVALTMTASAQTANSDAIPPIPRRLPPPGIKLKHDVRQNLEQQLAGVRERFAKQAKHPLAADVDVYIQAVELALKFDEFYSDKDALRAQALLETASHRLDALESGKSPWTNARGLVVRGYTSSIDGSAQPYGLVIPERLDLSKPAPLYVWLHGRGDKSTNLSFLQQRQSQAGRITPPQAIVLHAWGRHCLGFKSAGEIDVLEAIDHAAAQYNVDRRRIVLMGFSMGGAGCWHLGAHYADHWVAMSPGAGFAETARYQRIDPKTVPLYERKLWGVYDVPDYTRNLFNLPVIAYSGEIDKQKQAALVMEEAFAAEGRKLDHRIGPGMAHAYHPRTLADILKDIQASCDRGLDPSPRRVSLQTRTLRYHKLHWVDVQRLDEHWLDTRVDAERTADDKLELTTRNVAALRLTPDALPEQVALSIDGQTLRVAPQLDAHTKQKFISLVKDDGRWRAGEPNPRGKRPGLQGPIDDAFMAPFLVVLPSRKCRHPQVQRWVEFEQAHFLDRWQAVFRGQPRVKQDKDVTAEDFAQFNLVLWGDPTANSVLGKVVGRLPIEWTDEVIRVGEQRKDAGGHALVMIYPNPEAPDRYIVLNSGPTFREGHDRTNSLQNPKLPDWAIVDLSQPPDALSPGRIAAADFFDEDWRVRQSETPQRP